MKKWKILEKRKAKSVKRKAEEIIKILLENRGIKTKEKIEEFLHPDLKDVTPKKVGINLKSLAKAIKRIKKAIKNKEKIVIFGDYDVDGICGTAILWETLRLAGLAQGKPYENVFPYIPHRIDEGYGLSIKGISNVKFQILNVKLIITVDNGIVANEAVGFAKKQGIDVIITDHHVPSNPSTGSGLPEALAIVHTTKLCGTGVAWLLSKHVILSEAKNPRDPSATPQDDKMRHLELVALATVADLVPLKGANRTLLKFGLEALRKTKRVGLLELFKEAVLDKNSIGVYEIGHMIAPRLNAMGRLEYAMDSLRLICTNNKKRAEELAHLLGSTNKERQDLTLQAVIHAKDSVRIKKEKLKNLLFIAHESYEQGVIGLVAGKMVEEFYRPTIVVSIGETFSKASARSINGFNIIEFIREHSSFLVDAGGHPMAAGFTVETTKLIKLQKVLEKKAELMLTEDLLTRSLKIDCELPLSFINLDLYEALQRLSPFGMGNPEPTFISKGIVVEDVRLVGAQGKHLKLRLACHPEASAEGSKILRSAQNDKRVFEGIAFGMGERVRVRIGDKVDVVYTIDENQWNGEKRLQLKVKDIKNF